MKILSIGNSFSSDATAYLHQIALREGVEIETTNLYIGGCSLAEHYEHICEEDKAYIKEKNGISLDGYVSLADTLKAESWDYITLQQASYQSTDYTTYQPYLNELSRIIRN